MPSSADEQSSTTLAPTATIVGQGSIVGAVGVTSTGAQSRHRAAPEVVPHGNKLASHCPQLLPTNLNPIELHASP